MRITVASILVSLAVVSEISAAMISTTPNHALLARRLTRQKRCVQRQSGQNPPAANSATSSSSSAAAAPAPSPPPSTDNTNHSGGGNVIHVQGPCGDPNATENPTSWGGPNGSADWLTCGVRDSGWRPPPLTKENVIRKSLNDVKDSSLFSPCAGFIDAFNHHGDRTGIPAILLASIALQESSCRPYVTGRSGEIGLMQLTPEKCYGDCYDAWTNIGIGADYFQRTLDSVGGNIALAMGMYNGWREGITLDEANSRPTCGQRSNMDYLQNVFNGYLQGVDPGSMHMGTFFNVC